MASQQSARRVTRGTSKRITVDGDVQTSARSKAPSDERVHLLPADTASLMGFGADAHSDEECAAALERDYPERVGAYEVCRSQGDEGDLEDSADEHTASGYGQRRVVPAATPDCHLSLPGESDCTPAGADAEYESALSADEDSHTIVDVATRETVQRPPAAGPHQASRVTMSSGGERSTSDAAAQRQRQAVLGLRPEGAYHQPGTEQSVSDAAAQRQRPAVLSLRPDTALQPSGQDLSAPDRAEYAQRQADRDLLRPEGTQQHMGQQADADGSPQPPVSARAPEQVSGMRPPPVIVGPEHYDSVRRPKGRLTRTRDIATPTPVQYMSTQAVAAGDRRQQTEKYRTREELLPLEAPDENDIYQQIGDKRGKRGHYEHRESSLRMPLFDGGDWAGFISQFEACDAYYGWDEKTRAIRLYTSIIGDARKSLGSVPAGAWSFARLKKHMEVRFGKNKVFAQIQAELFSRQRRPDQTLYAFYDEIIAAANTANIPDDQRTQLIYTAFVYGLRSNKHMHRWVSRRDKEGTIESALELAEAYEDEYGADSVLQSLPVTVNARDSTGNALAVALPNMKSAAVSVDAVDICQGDTSLAQQMTAGFKKMEVQLTKQFETIDTRLGAVEKYQSEQIRRWEDRKSRNRQRRDHKRARNWNERGDAERDTNVSAREASNSKPRKSKNYSGKQSSKQDKSEVNARSSAERDDQSGDE